MTRFEIPTDWTFQTAHVVDHFDQHVREQLPWYDLAAGAAAHVARHYLPENGTIYDLGASTGNIGTLLAASISARAARLICVDNSQAMADTYTGPGTYIVESLEHFDPEPFDVAVCFLILMFVNVTERPALLDRLRAACRPGGAIVIVDRADPPTGYLGTVLRRLTLAGKVATGTPYDQIIDKELALAGIQRPTDIPALDRTARSFFQFGEFYGYVIER